LKDPLPRPVLSAFAPCRIEVFYKRLEKRTVIQITEP
jgi:hypothetical protein